MTEAKVVSVDTSKLESLREAVVEAEAGLNNLNVELERLEKPAEGEVDKEAVKAKKAEVKVATKTHKDAVKAVEKEEKVVERETKKAEREEAKLAKAKEREEAKAKREAEKAEKAAKREADRMPEQNGIRRPKPETLCGKVWTIADEVSSELGQPAPVSLVLERGEAQGLNTGNIKAEYARWRKFNGVTGRITAPKTPEEIAAEEAAEKAKAAKAEAKQAKAAKAEEAPAK
ncbi:transcriptional activator [Alteromonas phage vB_AcoS-R7M]|uniref:Transcriptional activator n=1 Tax=Alteromonas phage vB_AcoS-R7M TaxID=2729541 RepID=A0A6M3YN92_9CAUD|nr:transcriptional activator [Alteromonas phage vB_AcoS-R7M]QJI53372.1 transcriptional activator [Alteromonas phage vB_AcoS-R7M]